MTFWAFITLLNMHLGFLQVIIIPMNNGSCYHPSHTALSVSTLVLYQHEEGAES